MTKTKKPEKHTHASHHDKRFRLKRWQKNLIHFTILGVIVLCIVIEGAKSTDLAFLALSVITEVS